MLEVTRQRIVGLRQALPGVLNEGAEEQRLLVEARDLFEASGFDLLVQGRPETEVSGDVLLELAPGADEGNGAQILQAQATLTRSARGPACDIGESVEAKRRHPLEVGDELLVLAERTVMAVRGAGDLLEEILVLAGERRALLGVELILQARGHQLLQVVPGGLVGAELRAHRLTLDGQMDLTALDGAAHGAVELVGVPPAAGGRAAATVEEDHADTALAGKLGQPLLRAVYLPVGGDISAVLCAVGEAEHDVLRVSPA